MMPLRWQSELKSETELAGNDTHNGRSLSGQEQPLNCMVRTTALEVLIH